MKNQHRSRRKTQWIQGKSRPMKKKGRCAAQKMGKCYKKTILKWYEFMQYCGHPPRGGCGLKSLMILFHDVIISVIPHAGDVD